jgi:predicted dehydrogenase
LPDGIVQAGSADLGLRALGEGFHVRLLLPDEAAAAEAQAAVDRAGLQGRFTVGVFDRRHLPFTEGVVNAVLIATPDHWHATATVLACQAGKDVYVEKPLGHNVAEGRAMVDAARRLACRSTASGSSARTATSGTTREASPRTGAPTVST